MASIGDPSIKAGEVALNEGDYDTAIAHFQAVCAVELDPAVVARAQQALIVAYTNSGRIAEAIAFCQQLSEVSPDNRWAEKTLADLRRRYPDAEAAANLGYEAEYTKQIQSQQAQIEEKVGLPVPIQQAESVGATVFRAGRQWRNQERAQRWKPMKRLKIRRLWFVQAVTAIAFFWVFRATIELALELINDWLVALPYLQPIQLFYRDPTSALLIFLVILLIVCPWLLDGYFQLFHEFQPFKLSELASKSPEAAKLLPRYCRKRKIPLPKLGILPTDIPLAMCYGNLPRTARIVVSQGLLDRLDDDEIATVYASELAHIVNRDFIFMSVVLSVIQIPYTIYWQISILGDRFPQLLSHRYPNLPKFVISLVRGIFAAIAALFYGIYWLWRLPLLWFSRRRNYYSDRFAAETTGNPNGVCRGIVKMAIAIAEDLKKYGYTSFLLEGFDLVMPIGYRQGINLGSLPHYTPLETVLAWECTNPYRHWLKTTNSHALTGDRLYLLSRYAYFWQLEPEFNLPAIAPPPPNNTAKFEKIKNSYRALPILQSAFLAGIFFGIVLRITFWLIGIIADWLNIWQLIWLHNAGAFLNACILAAFSLSIIIWINGYFPDIKLSPTRTDPRLQDLLADTTSLPPDSQGVRLQGKLLGRRGLSNRLVQDLVLETPTGLIKLHFYSKIGPLGGILPFFPNPTDWVNQQVTVCGWLRRSSTPWVDVDTITKNNQTIRTGYPIWVTSLAVVAAVWAAYLIWTVAP
ncbi:MAG: M48 family metalloprotease [Kamptonema sp. SIO1D9]|nr:M48 family metalloprotease [Kamptonema sp. SIO1D9]